MSYTCHHFWKCYKTLTFYPLSPRCITPCACHANRDLNVKKVVFLTFWLRNVLASRHNSVQIGPNLVCLVHFDFEMCFAPQRRALCRHLNFQKWSEHVRTCCVLYILTSKCASRIPVWISPMGSRPSFSRKVSKFLTSAIIKWWFSTSRGLRKMTTWYCYKMKIGFYHEVTWENPPLQHEDWRLYVFIIRLLEGSTSILQNDDWK